MKEKQAVTRRITAKFKRATKKQKGRTLDMLAELATCNHSYTALVLQ